MAQLIEGGQMFNRCAVRKCLVGLTAVRLSRWRSYRLLMLNSRAQRAPAPPAPWSRRMRPSKSPRTPSSIPDMSVGGVPNVGIVVGNRATLVIDTGLGQRNGETVMREVQKVSKNSELYLATTHFHPEHDLGASAFPAIRR